MRKNPKYSVRLQSQIYIKNINSKVYKVTESKKLRYSDTQDANKS